MSSLVAGDAEYAEVCVKPRTDFDLAENVCYGDQSQMGLQMARDKASTSKCSGNTSKNVVILSVLLTALVLGLMAACIAFAAEIKKLRNEIGSITAQMQIQQVSSQLDNFTEQVATLGQNTSQVLNTVSGKLDNLTLQDYSSRIQQLATFSNISVQLLRENISALEFLLYRTGREQDLPASSCAALPPSSPSDYYWVRASGGSAVRVYCDMTRSCGGVTGGWMRVAQLDMTNTSHQCPSPLRESTQSSIRTCLRTEALGGCTSIAFPKANIHYRHVCGKVTAYQYGQPEAFREDNNISSRYVDGVSITHGTPKQHIWTFAAALDESVSQSSKFSCPCIRPDLISREIAHIPSFVGDDYFCDTGSRGEAETNVFYSDDPLWDGAGCGPESTCCSFNTPPWFYRQLSHTTTDDVEMRLCRSLVVDNEDIGIEKVNLFVR